MIEETPSYAAPLAGSNPDEVWRRRDEWYRIVTAAAQVLVVHESRRIIGRARSVSAAVARQVPKRSTAADLSSCGLGRSSFSASTRQPRQEH